MRRESAAPGRPVDAAAGSRGSAAPAWGPAFLAGGGFDGGLLGGGVERRGGRLIDGSVQNCPRVSSPFSFFFSRLRYSCVPHRTTAAEVEQTSAADYARFFQLRELQLLDRELRPTERRIKAARFPVASTLDTSGRPPESGRFRRFLYRSSSISRERRRPLRADQRRPSCDFEGPAVTRRGRSCLSEPVAGD